MSRLSINVLPREMLELVIGHLARADGALSSGRRQGDAMC